LHTRLGLGRCVRHNRLTKRQSVVDRVEDDEGVTQVRFLQIVGPEATNKSRVPLHTLNEFRQRLAGAGEVRNDPGGDRYPR
jgi:hypothetical protein